LFEGGIDVDFIVVSLANALQGFQNSPMVVEIMQRGRRVLLIRMDYYPRRPPCRRPWDPSSRRQAGVPETVNDFWFHAAWTAKNKRGEIWVAKSCCDHYLKGLLLAWWNGKLAPPAAGVQHLVQRAFLEEWALPATVEELRRAFAHFDAEDIWRALQATMRTFRRISRDLAMRLDYPYPAGCDEGVSQWISMVNS
jgi:aminoglycoside 6-adenylyltransferase